MKRNKLQENVDFERISPSGTFGESEIDDFERITNKNKIVSGPTETVDYVIT